MGVAQSRRDTGDRTGSAIYYSEAITLLRNAEATERLAYALRHAAEVRSELREYAAASSHIQEAVSLYRTVSDPDPLGLANALRVSALNDEREARASWTEARDLYQSVAVAAGVEEATIHLESLQIHEAPMTAPQETIA